VAVDHAVISFFFFFGKLVSKNISITLSSFTILLVDPLAGVLEGH